MPAVQNALQAFFGKAPQRTVNSEEVIAKGAAVQAAMLSPSKRVQLKFEVIDGIPYSINLAWNGAGEAMDVDGAAPPSSGSIVFKSNDPIPSEKVISFKRAEPFEIVASYANVEALSEGVSPALRAEGGGGSLTLAVKVAVSGMTPKDGAPVKVKVGFTLDHNGCLRATGAHTPEETEVEEEVKGADGAVERKVVKRSVKTPLTLTSTAASGLSEVGVGAFVTAEFEMATQDRIVRETEERRNDLETYVYEMRDALGGALGAFGGDGEKTELGALFQENEDWLCSEEGEGATKSAYVERLVKMKVRERGGGAECGWGRGVCVLMNGSHPPSENRRPDPAPRKRGGESPRCRRSS